MLEGAKPQSQPKPGRRPGELTAEEQDEVARDGASRRTSALAPLGEHRCARWRTDRSPARGVARDVRRPGSGVAIRMPDSVPRDQNAAASAAEREGIVDQQGAALSAIEQAEVGDDVHHPQQPGEGDRNEVEGGNTAERGDASPGAGVVGPGADAPEVPEPNEPA